MVLMAIVGELGCHSEDTKVLTPSRLKTHQELSKGSTVLAMNSEGEIIKTVVSKVNEFDYEREMIHIYSSTFDFLVTPNHKMITYSQETQDFEKVLAENLTFDQIIPTVNLPYNVETRNHNYSIEKQNYNSTVWSLTTGEGNYITVRDGKASISANSGKTLSLTYLAYRNYVKFKDNDNLRDNEQDEGKRIYSNYDLDFPHKLVKSPSGINDMKNGYFTGDELWLWLGSRASQKKKNKIISAILLRSRKRGIHISYTTQNFGQIDKRVRDITDLKAVPQMNPKKTHCHLYILSHPSNQVIRTFKFDARPYFEMYDTAEEIDDFDMDLSQL